MAKQEWKNRIVGYEDRDPAQLLANPSNWRMHGARQQQALNIAIGLVGFLDPVIVQQGTDMVVDGHLRVLLAMRHGEPTIPVQYVDLNDEEAALILATFDPIGDLAESDDEMLAELLGGMEDDGVEALRVLQGETVYDDSGRLVSGDGPAKDVDHDDGTEFVLCPYCAHAFPFNKETKEYV